jgi:translation initiation factor eIF-2B subunit alpha
MQLEQELRASIALLKSSHRHDLCGRTHISLGSGCDLFMKFVTRAFSLESSDFAGCKRELLRRGEKFANMSLLARTQIAEVGHSFIQDGNTVLIHGVSRVVTTVILKAAESRSFRLIVTEGRPTGVS